MWISTPFFSVPLLLAFGQIAACALLWRSQFQTQPPAGPGASLSLAKKWALLLTYVALSIAAENLFRALWIALALSLWSAPQGAIFYAPVLSVPLAWNAAARLIRWSVGRILKRRSATG